MALATSLLGTRLARSLALKFHAVDDPDGQRKLQERPIPLWGGVAVFAALSAGLLVAWQLTGADTAWLNLVAVMMLSAAAIFVLGFIDDWVDLPGRVKLLAQIVSVLPIILAGHWFDRIVVFNCPLELGYWGVPLTMLWLVCCINAVNLLDGMDGNASVIGLVACGAIALIAWKHGHDHVALTAVAMTGAILGFLVFNLPPATIYLGDCGSTVIGLVAGYLCLEATRLETGELRIAGPIAIMTLPILDTTLAVIRRRLTGRRFDCGDRGHIHHRLLERGLTVRQALAFVAGVCLVTAIAVVAAIWTNREPVAWITSLALVVVMTHLRYFGHYELALVVDTVNRVADAVRESVWIVAHPSLRRLAREVSDLSFDDGWRLLTNELADSPAGRLELRLLDGPEVQASFVWASYTGTKLGESDWRRTMLFGRHEAVRCELSIVGRETDVHPAQWTYLSALVRLFGRHWARHPDLLALPQVLPIGERPAIEYRDAA